VVEAMAPFWTEEFGNPHSSAHAFGWRAEDAVSNARTRIAELIGADSEEIVFTSGATEANNLALLGLLNHEAADGRNVVISAVEHKCVLQTARQLERNGFEVKKAPVTASGHVDLDALASLIDARTALVSVMMVNNEIGTIQPIEMISSFCRRAEAVFHSDAAQAPTGVRIDVEAMGVDLLSLSSHKMYGPKGIGALFVSRSVRRRMRPIVHGGGQEGGLRSGTLPTPLCVGFGEAARITKARLDDDAALLSESRRLFLDALRTRVPDAVVIGTEPRHPGQLNLRFPGVDAEMVVAHLQPRLAVSNGAACSSGIPEPSHVLRAIGLDGETAEECIRVGFGRFFNHPQARDAANLIADAVAEIRANSPVETTQTNG
jgi:cysteine desulfurase